MREQSSTDIFEHMKAIKIELINKRYHIAESKVIEYLKVYPLSAQGWMLLGESLMRQKFGDAARAVFKRAALLDPQATWLDQVESVLQHTPSGIVRPDIVKLLKVKSVSVAAAIITHNEERSIARCIRSLLDAVDEIIVIDSSSTDRTLDIVKQFPQVRVVPNVPLNDNFAAKRNEGLKHITSDWVLWVDADEWLEQEDVAHVREVAGLFHDSPVPVLIQVCHMNHINGYIETEYSVPRMFPLARGLCYKGRIHEQIVLEQPQSKTNDHALNKSGIERRRVRIRLHHDGYELDVMKQKNKLARNTRLLHKMIEEEPDNPSWWLLYGRETMFGGQLEKALHIFLKTEQMVKNVSQFERAPDLYRWMIHIYIRQHRFEQAENVCLRAMDRHPDFPDFHYWLSRIRIHQATKLLKKAEEGLLRSKQAFHTYRGTVTAEQAIWDWKADIALAELVRMSGKREKAERMVQKVVQKHPDAALFMNLEGKRSKGGAE